MSWPDGGFWLFFVFGAAYMGVGLYGLVKFAGQVVRPSSDAYRRARLPFLLFVGRPICGGLAFVLAALTHSLIPAIVGVVVFASDAVIRHLTRRRLGDLLDQ